MQPLDLGLGGLKPGLEVGGLVLHGRILGDQKFDDSADLFGGGDAWQALVDLCQADGISRLSVHIGAH